MPEFMFVLCRAMRVLGGFSARLRSAKCAIDRNPQSSQAVFRACSSRLPTRSEGVVPKNLNCLNVKVSCFHYHEATAVYLSQRVP
jgi:hypothetical protein